MSRPSSTPESWSTVSPYLIVPGARALIAFLERVLDAHPGRCIEREPGVIAHAEVSLGESVIMLADAVPAWPSIPTHVHVYVADVDAVYRRALEAAADSVQEPKQSGDEDKRGGFRDASGVTWWIATRVD
jgi:uncharacterized glyoxalase superfamily protein PhnB